MSSNKLPESKEEALAMARKMCEEHWGSEKKPFRDVPWEWDDDEDSFIDDAQDEIEKYLDEHNILYSVQQRYPKRYMFK